MKKTVSLYAIATAFAMFALSLFSTGTVSGQAPSLPFQPDTTATARIQVIHNSADAAAADLPFRTQLMDATGRIVFDEVSSGSGYKNDSIDVSALPEGMYILRFNSEKEQHTSRVLVRR